MRTVLAFVAVAVLAAPASAGEIYRWREGRTVCYADLPPQGNVTLMPMPWAPDVPIAKALDGPDVPAMPAPQPAESPQPPRAIVAAVRAIAPAVPVKLGPATVDEVLELSGLRSQLASISRALGGEYLPRPGQLSDRDAQLVTQVVARNFAPERLYASIRDDFRRNTEQRQLDEMALWFRSELGRKVTELEVAASHPDAAAKIAAFASKVATTPPAPSRLDLVRRLDWVTGASEDTTELALAVAGSIARAAAAALPADRRTRGGSVERRMEALRAQISSTVGANVVAQMLYVYEPLSDEELKQYVDFLTSPAGRAYGRAAHVSMLHVIREVADRTAAETLRAVPIQRWAAAQKTAEAAPGR
jgi:hypothetical protein